MYTVTNKFWQTYKSIYSILNKLDNISFTQQSSLGPLDPTPFPSPLHCHPPLPTHTHTEATSVLIFITIVYFACFELHINGITAHVLFCFWLLSCNTVLLILMHVAACILKFLFHCMNISPFLYLFSFYRHLGFFPNCWLLYVKLLWTFLYILYIFVDICFHWSLIVRNWIAESYSKVCLNLWETAQFSKSFVLFSHKHLVVF